LINLNIVGHNTKNDRVDYDFYPTPEIATLKLLEKESFKGDIWECACGDGAISKILKSKNYKVFSSDIVCRDYGETTMDFLKSKMGNTKKYESLVSVVRPLKELLDEVGTDAKNAGIDIQLRKNYFPVQYDLSDRKKETIFREEGLKNGVNKNELENIITNIKEQGGFYFTNFFGEQFRKNKFSERNPNSNLEFTRKLPEPMIDALADKGVVNTNILEVLPSYLMKAAKDIEYESRFKNVDKRAETLLNQNKISDTEYNRIGNTLQAILGKYGTSVPSSLRTPYQFALSAGYIITLPLAALTALAEPLILLSRAKPGSALKSAIQLPVNAFRRTARVFLPRLKKADSEKAFDEMMYGLDGALTERMNASSAIEIPQRLSQQFFKTTMLTQVTQLSRQMAFDSFKSELKNDIKKIRNINSETLEAFDIKRKYREVGIPDIISTVKNLETNRKYYKTKSHDKTSSYKICR